MVDVYSNYHFEDSGRRVSGIFHIVWRFMRWQKAKLILRHAPARSKVCDVGCERGELLNVLKQSGWSVQGTQLSKPAADFAWKNFGIEVYVGDLPDAPFADDVFDVIVMINVLEHLPDPEVYMAQIRSMLRPGGIFWLEVPNSGSFTARICRKRWFHNDPEHHFWGFNKDGVARLLGRYGFTIEQIYHYSWEHGPIGCLQSWLNFLPGPSNVVFQIVRDGLSGEFRRLAIQSIHVALSVFLLPAACVVSAIESFLGNGQIILVRARKHGS